MTKFKDDGSGAAFPMIRGLKKRKPVQLDSTKWEEYDDGPTRHQKYRDAAEGKIDADGLRLEERIMNRDLHREDWSEPPDYTRTSPRKI